MKPHHSHAKSSINQMSAFSIFTQKAHKKPIKLLKVSDINQKYKQHMMSPINRKYQIKFSLPEILKKDLDPHLSSRKIGNDPSFNSVETSCENRYRLKTKEISLHSPKQAKFLSSLSPVSQSYKANQHYPSENILKDHTFEPLKKVLPRSLKPLKYKETEEYEPFYSPHSLLKDSLNSLTSSKKLDTEETSHLEGLTLDQFLEANLPLDKWHSQSSHPLPVNDQGLDRYGLKLTPIMSEISRDSREGGKRSQYDKSKRMLVDVENSPSNQSVTPKENKNRHQKKPSAFKIELENKESFSPTAALKSVPETKKMVPSKPIAGHYSHKNSRSSTMVRKYVIDEAAIVDGSPTEGLSFSEYFQDFVVDKKGYYPLVLSGTRIGATVNDSSDHCIEKVVSRNSKRDENQFRRSRTQLGSVTSLDSRSNTVDPTIYQKVTDILNENNNPEERRTSKCWNLKNIRKSVDPSEQSYT